MGHSRTRLAETHSLTGELPESTSAPSPHPADHEASEIHLWKVFFENNPEAVAVLSPDDRVLRINTEFTRLFGYESGEVLDRSINDLIVPEPLVENSREYKRQLTRGGRVEVETVRRRKDGSEVYVSLLAVPVVTPSGEHVADCAMYRDITKRKRAEEQLRESEARFQALADTAPVMIWMTGTDGLCNYFNKPWLDFTGRTMEQEVGTGWVQGVHPDDVQGCFDNYLPRFHAREPFRMEYRLRRVDGEYRWVVESGIPRYTPGGEFSGYIGSNIDITDYKRAESLLSGEKRILEMLAKGASLPEMLEALCRFVEEQANDVLASILLLDDHRLRHGAAPSLPKAYTDTIDGALIGPSAGSCGTAAYRGEQVIVEDITTDPLWVDYCGLALSHGLRACWSTPVFSSEAKVIATFAMYCRHPKKPSRRDLEIIERITHLAGVAIERKLAQDALRNSEAYLAEAQRIAHMGAWVWRVEGREPVYLSDEWFRIFGFDPNSGAPNWEQRLERIHPQDRARWTDTIERAIRDESDYEVEFRILLPNGKTKYLNTVGHPVTNGSGDLIKFIGISIDITERKRIEEVLRQSEAYLAEAQRLTQTGSWAFDPNVDKMVYWSEETFRIFGFDPHEGAPTLETFRQRIHPEDRERTHLLWSHTSHRKMEYLDDYRALLPDGTVKYVHVIGHPALDETGRILEYVGTVVDVTDRRRAEEERDRLRQLETDLARISRVSIMGELAASLAHEIKQPVTAAMLNAKACTHWLGGGTPNLAEACNAAARMVSNTERTAQIIDRVRSLYSRDTSQRELLDVNEIIREMTVLLQEKATRGSVSIRNSLAAELPLITADRVQLQQVLINLMLNGIEAMRDAGGVLAITSAMSGEEQLLISVSDSGIGIGSEQTNKIFEAFYTTKSHGTGMGLSISRRIIESHGGRVWANPNSAHGTTFMFTLPIQATVASSTV